MLDGIQCPHCGSENNIKDGFKKDIQRYLCKDCKRRFSETTMIQDQEIVEENVKLAKKTQKFADSNRIERKSFREYARIENAIAEYNKELIKILEENSIHVITKKHENTEKEDCVLIVQLSDLHFNEQIYDVVGNKFDFYIACKRLKKFANRIKNICKTQNIKQILIACTGDFLNSDRRLDELLSKATNRAKATFLAVEILEQFICDLNKIANISISCVTGNESRVKDELGYSEIVATDNYDFSIFNILKLLFKDSKGIIFINGGFSENVIKVGNVNILITHGTNITSSGVHSTVQQIFGRYSSKGIKLAMVLFGHLHASYVGDLFARSSSLCGANSYSEFGLNLNGKASQLVHLIYKDSSIDSYKIDLQNTDDIQNEYKIKDDNNVYNIKSDKKLKENKIIYQITI